MIDSISIVNFKSFGETSLDLSPLSVFVGPNGAGKTNFIDAFRFLKESMIEGISVAADRRGGWNGIRCRKKRSQVISFTLTGKLPAGLRVGPSSQDQQIEVRGLKFEYMLRFRHITNDFGDRYEVISEQAALHSTRSDPGLEDQTRRLSFFDRGLANIAVEEHITFKDKYITFYSEPSQSNVPVPPSNRARLFASVRFFSFASLVLDEEIERWRFLDPDPQAACRPSEIRDVEFVSETGDTLALVLHKLKSPSGPSVGDAESVLEIMQTLVPGFSDWETELLSDGRITFKIKEKDLRGTLPSTLVSQGTVRLLIILTALLVERDQPTVVFIEEPERSLHPLVMSQLVDLMREVSNKIQIIVATHSADLVRWCRPAEVYFVDKVNGLTQILRASNVEQIDQFLQSFTLDELWLQGYIERGIPL